MNTPGYTWSVSLGPNPYLDFCVWVLERDGLRVAPFDRHDDGDGSLRAAGMTAAAWRAWLGRVDAAEREFNRQLGGDTWPPRPKPAALWEGVAAVSDHVAELAAEYDDLFNERKDASMHLERTHRADGDRSFWHALVRFDQLLPPLKVAFVAYPAPARLVIPPATIVLAAVGWHPAPGELTVAVVAGATELAASPG
jgi:hypothetical protein